MDCELTERLISLEEAVAVSIVLSRLNFTRRERLLLDRLMADEVIPLREIALLLGVSKQSVSRADQRLKQRLRHEFQAMRIAA